MGGSKLGIVDGTDHTVDIPERYKRSTNTRCLRSEICGKTLKKQVSTCWREQCAQNVYSLIATFTIIGIAAPYRPNWTLTIRFLVSQLILSGFKSLRY